MEKNIFVSKEDIVNLLQTLDKSLDKSFFLTNNSYSQHRRIISSLFTNNLALDYYERVILRLSVIDSLYSTNAAYNYFSFEAMADKISLLVKNDRVASEYFYGIVTKKHDGKELFEECYGIRKNLDSGSKQMSLLSKYAYYLLLQNQTQYPLGFPIYDSLAIAEYPKICTQLGIVSMQKKSIKNDIGSYIQALNTVRESLFDNSKTDYHYKLQQFDLLDAYLWRMGKFNSGNISLLLNRKEYTSFIENIGLNSYIAENKNNNFANKVVSLCKELPVEDILRNINNQDFRLFLEHWKNVVNNVI